MVAAGLTLDFSEKYLTGISNVHTITERLYKAEVGQIQESDLMAVKAKRL